MIKSNILEMTDDKIESFCKQLAKASRASMWRALKALMIDAREGYWWDGLSRKNLIIASHNTNVYEDIRFLLKHELIEECCPYPKRYRLHFKYGYEKIEYEDIMNMCFNFKDELEL